MSRQPGSRCKAPELSDADRPLAWAFSTPRDPERGRPEQRALLLSRVALRVPGAQPSFNDSDVLGKQLAPGVALSA
ncbi:hypothetical protein FRC06_009842, partial [Ceratobasidium sp. 370]